MINIHYNLFRSPFISELPVDATYEPGSRQVHAACASLVKPTPVARPTLIGWSSSLSEKFSFPRPSSGDESLNILAGNLDEPNWKTYAACYGGHQFGHWAGQLGDGRAIALGEVKDLEGKSWEFQLKGAGPTPYSRRADGRAVLRSSIREFVCSEAMEALGVPTTRALSVVGTGEPVLRDMFYDGHPENEPGAIVCRVAPSFLRFGNYEIFAARGELDVLKQLVDYSLHRFFPEIDAKDPKYLAHWFREVTKRTAFLMSEWMRVGFVHGVMNTDNMSILGLTIDYGPYGWIDNYDPSWTPNTTDLPGRRYAFGRQPSVSLWNLAQFGNALLALDSTLEADFGEILEGYQQTFQDHFLTMTAAKLGLRSISLETDAELVVGLDQLLAESQTDMTLFYRKLADLNPQEELPSFLEGILYEPLSETNRERWISWFRLYKKRIAEEAIPVSERIEKMNAANPLYVPRNYLLQEVIEKATRGEFSAVEELLEVLKQPYRFQPGREAFSAMRPEWAVSKPGCSTLSCSS